METMNIIPPACLFPTVPVQEPKQGDARNWGISVTHGISGHFAIMVAEFYDVKLGWYPDIQTSGIGRFSDKADAIRDAKAWAEVEELPYVGPAQ